MSTSNLPGRKERPAREADNVIVLNETVVNLGYEYRLGYVETSHMNHNDTQEPLEP
jgi:hypothetical protein